MLQNLVSDGDVILDVGANMGWYSINLALTHRSAKIHAFEPIPTTYHWLGKNVEINGLSNVEIHNFGLSNKVGTFDFFLTLKALVMPRRKTSPEDQMQLFQSASSSLYINSNLSIEIRSTLLNAMLMAASYLCFKAERKPSRMTCRLFFLKFYVSGLLNSIMTQMKSSNFFMR